MMLLLLGTIVHAYTPPYIGTWKGRKLIGESFKFTYDSVYWHTSAGTAAFSYKLKNDTLYLLSKYVVFKLPFKANKYAGQLANISLTKK